MRDLLKCECYLLRNDGGGDDARRIPVFAGRLPAASATRPGASANSAQQGKDRHRPSHRIKRGSHCGEVKKPGLAACRLKLEPGGLLNPESVT